MRPEPGWVRAFAYGANPSSIQCRCTQEGAADYALVFAGSNSDINLDRGSVTVESFHPATHTARDVSGSFVVSHHFLILRLRDVAGSTVFRWNRTLLGEQSQVGGVLAAGRERLDLTFVRTSVDGSVYGMPAEVFFRMWAALPFYSRAQP